MGEADALTRGDGEETEWFNDHLSLAELGKSSTAVPLVAQVPVNRRRKDLNELIEERIHSPDAQLAHAIINLEHREWHERFRVFRGTTMKASGQEMSQKMRCRSIEFYMCFSMWGAADYPNLLLVRGQAEVERFQSLLMERSDTLADLSSFLGRNWDVKSSSRASRVRVSQRRSSVLFCLMPRGNWMQPHAHPNAVLTRASAVRRKGSETFCKRWSGKATTRAQSSRPTAATGRARPSWWKTPSRGGRGRVVWSGRYLPVSVPDVIMAVSPGVWALDAEFWYRARRV